MSVVRILAIVLIIAGPLGLVYGRVSYTRETQEAKSFDYSSESLPVFLVLKDLIQDVKPNITVLTVETAQEHHPKPSVMFEGLEKAFRSSGLQLRNVKIEASDVEGGILDYVKTYKPRLIAMSSHGRPGFAESMHPSVTKAILHDSGAPILVVHGHSMPTAKTVGSLSDFLRTITG